MSNEQGNDTAAGQAFQVGDRVRIGLSTGLVDGTIESIEDGRAWVYGMATSDGYPFSANCPFAHLTLVSRATPAASEPAAPAQANPIHVMQAAMPAALGSVWHEWNEACYRDNVQPAVALITLVGHAARVGANAAVDMLAPNEPSADGEPDQRHCLRCGGWLTEAEQASHRILCYRCMGEVFHPTSEPVTR